MSGAVKEMREPGRTLLVRGRRTAQGWAAPGVCRSSWTAPGGAHSCHWCSPTRAGPPAPGSRHGCAPCCALLHGPGDTFRTRCARISGTSTGPVQHQHLQAQHARCLLAGHMSFVCRAASHSSAASPGSCCNWRIWSPSCCWASSSGTLDSLCHPSAASTRCESDDCTPIPATCHYLPHLHQPSCL